MHEFGINVGQRIAGVNMWYERSCLLIRNIIDIDNITGMGLILSEFACCRTVAPVYTTCALMPEACMHITHACTYLGCLACGRWPEGEVCPGE